MRPALALALVLVLVIAAASAMLRLSNAGAGCVPWPSCLAEHTAAGEAAPAPVPAWHEPVRLAHRVAASAAGLVFVFVVLFGWARWARSERLAGLALLGLSVALAWIGRYTPSALPAVVVANLLGGHLLLAALVWLSVRPVPADGARQRATALPWLLLGLVLLQEALGALVSARGAAAACLGGCAVLPDLPALAAATDPWRGNAALPAPGAALPERQALLQAHAWSALALAAAALAAALRWRRRPVAWLPLATVAGAAGLGWAMRGQGLPLAAALLHSLLGAAALVAATVLARRVTAAAAGQAAAGPPRHARAAAPHTAAP